MFPPILTRTTDSLEAAGAPETLETLAEEGTSTTVGTREGSNIRDSSHYKDSRNINNSNSRNYSSTREHWKIRGCGQQQNPRMVETTIQ
jgi:hypothetical protein